MCIICCSLLLLLSGTLVWSKHYCVKYDVNDAKIVKWNPPKLHVNLKAAPKIEGSVAPMNNWNRKCSIFYIEFVCRINNADDIVPFQCLVAELSIRLRPFGENKSWVRLQFPVVVVGIGGGGGGGGGVFSLCSPLFAIGLFVIQWMWTLNTEQNEKCKWEAL